MSFYTGITLLTELLMLAMTIHVLNHTGFPRRQKTWFILTFTTIMLCAGAEYAARCGYYDPAFALPLTALTVLQFSVAPLLGVLFSGALGIPHQRKLAARLFAFNFVFQVAAAPFGWIFHYGSEGYTRGAYFFVYAAIYCFGLAYMIRSAVIVGRRFRHRDTGTIIMLLVVMLAGIAPMSFFRLSIAYVAIAISATLCYIYYNDLIQADIKAELIAHQEKLSIIQEHIITGMASLIENRDMETGEHVARTSAYVKTLAECARADGLYADAIDDEFIAMMYALAPLHDIGKIVVPDQILRKPGRLTAEEFEQMKKHAAAGGRIVHEVLNEITEAAYVAFASDIACCHHERWDGTGYPDGLKGEAIPLSARIMAIADVFDALISERCYKKPMPRDQAFEIIRDGAGTHFDPRLADVFLRHREKFE